MTVSINGITIPLSIRDTGSYAYVPFADSTENGLGETISAGLPSITWTFPVLYPVDFGWWVTTVLGGANYLKAPAVLLTDLDVEVTYTQVIVRRPTYSGRINGLYQSVVVKIDTMKL
jgi:hypothetical protein